MARRRTKRAAARKRTNLVHRQGPGAVWGDRLRARSLRMESLENRCLLAGDALASIELVVVDSQGAPLTHVEVGDEFVLRGIVRDLRENAAGVFAAYTDVTFDAALASATAPLVSAAAFSGGEQGDLVSEGHYSEVGGFRSEDRTGDGAGAAGEVFFSIPLIADAAGELLIAANTADSLPAHDVLLFGINEYIAQDKIEYGFVRLQIGDASEAPPSPWRNPDNPSDVNNDGGVDASDVQQLQAELELRAGQTNLDPAQAGKPPYFDVTGDRLVTPDDLAAVYLQLPAARPATNVPGGNPPPAPGGDPAPEEPRGDATEWLLARIEPWLNVDWQIELRVTNGLTEEAVTQARVGDILHVHAILHVPEQASSADVDRFLPILSRNILPPFTQTALAYDPTKLGLVQALDRRDAYAVQRANIDRTQDPAAILEAHKKIVEGEHWLVGASFVVLETGANLFSTSPDGTEPGAGLASIPSGAEINASFAARIPGSAALQEFGEKLFSKLQQTAATVNLSAALTRPTAQNDTYDLSEYRGDFTVAAEQGVLANDAAATGAKALLVRPAAHGTVTLNPDGSIRYAYDFERLHHISDTFAYVVVNPDGTSEFTEVDIRADKLPPLAEVRVRAIDENGRPLESVNVGDTFYLQAVVTDLRPDGVGSLSNARGAKDALIGLAFSSDTLQVDGPVEIDSQFTGKTNSVVRVWSEVGPGQVRVRGYSNTGPRAGELEVFRIKVVATAAGASEVSVDRASLKLRAANVGNIPARLVERRGFSLEVQPDPSAARLWSNALNPLDVTGDGQIAPADALQVINYLNTFGARPVPATLSASTLSAGQVYLDADADNFISPSDALAIINHLNSRRTGAEGESTSPSAAPAGEPSSRLEADLLTLLASDLVTEGRRRR